MIIMMRYPGFIDIGTVIPAGKWKQASELALRSGYTYLIASPSADEIITEKEQIQSFLQEAAADSQCDYTKLANITPENIRTTEEWADEVPGAFLDFSVFSEAGSFAQMNLLTRLFSRWPADKPICVRGTESQIGSAIFMGQVHQRKVHVCGAATRPVIELISEAKRSGLKVTCDIHPLSLMISAEEGSEGSLPLRAKGTEDDRRALWQYFKNIDCFSSANYQAANGNGAEGLNVMLPLLFSMLNSEMLKLEDILLRCCMNPAKLFGIRLEPSTYIELDEERIREGGSGSYVKTVSLHGKTVCSSENVKKYRMRRAERNRRKFF